MVPDAVKTATIDQRTFSALPASARDRDSKRAQAGSRITLGRLHLAPDLPNMLALRLLRRQEKRLDQLAIAANRRTGESLVPLTLGYLRLAIEPLDQQF